MLLANFSKNQANVRAFFELCCIFRKKTFFGQKNPSCNKKVVSSFLLRLIVCQSD